MSVSPSYTVAFSMALFRRVVISCLGSETGTLITIEYAFITDVTAVINVIVLLMVWFIFSIQ